MCYPHMSFYYQLLPYLLGNFLIHSYGKIVLHACLATVPLASMQAEHSRYNSK
uniref:Uncharacterized protein n=1 Tax=Oryza brachyantha TaxID=4533 RepID=J3KWS2_ORYBR